MTRINIYKINKDTWILGIYYFQNSQIKLPTNLAKWFVDSQILTVLRKEGRVK